MCQTFLPHLTSTHGRIVNLASIASQLKFYSPAIQSRFRSASTLSDLSSLCSDFQSAVSSSAEESSGFGPPPRAYSVSKALVRSLTSILARDNPDVTINCCCPGWINTEMGNLVASKGRTAPKTGEEGARIPVRLAVAEDLGGTSGGYWANESVRSRGEGRVEEEWV
jgi:carbonyl reductase 1